jgi:prepilin peptidase CpaA
MQSPRKQNALSELGGAQWGLLPALASLPFIISQAGNPAGLKSMTFLLMAALMASSDVATRRIPNQLTVLAAIGGLSWGLMAGGFTGLGQALLGGAVGFGLMLVFHLFGAVGAGDVKALGALGCFLAPWPALTLFVLTALAGGVLAITRMIATRRGFSPAPDNSLPYGLAIAAGAVVLVLQGGLP